MKNVAGNTVNTTEYGFWQSSVSLEHVFAQKAAMTYPSVRQHDFFYMTTLAEQKGRSVLMRCALGQPNSTAQCITPKPFSLRTKVNEYGGKSYWLVGDDIYFVNQADQHLYRQTLHDRVDDCTDGKASTPVQLSPYLANGKQAMFADLQVMHDGRLLAVMELSDESGSENKMCLAAIDARYQNKPVITLAEGADFYSNLVLNTQQTQIAWVEWQHPSMPWDSCQLWLADLIDEQGQLKLDQPRQIDIPNNASVCQLAFAHNGELYFSMDVADSVNSIEQFWQVYCVQPKLFEGLIPIRSTLSQQQEFGYPHWQYGDHRIIALDTNRMLAIGSAPTQDYLYLIDTGSHLMTQVDLGIPYVGLQSLSVNQQCQVSLLVMYVDAPPSLVHLDLSDLSATVSHQAKINTPPSILKKQAALLPSSQVSKAQHIQFSTRDDQHAYGFYYPPHNTQYSPSIGGQPPPLIVMVHGGPTARCYGHFDIQKQFWTNRGFAVFDVNHRGSSGYGRPFRDALYNHWGVMDIDDVVDGIHALADQGLIDINQVCIRGKSAGGYTVLRALTEHPDLFKAGASYYGIGNLVTLAEHTHKFEKHYTDRLIGEVFDAKSAVQPQSLFSLRSPIHAVSKIQSAMILFQGLDDKIVPPQVAQEVVSALRQNNVSHEYVEYEGEGHGFRQTATNIDAWSKELAFYQQVLV